jgi:hypothetical protein
MAMSVTSKKLEQLVASIFRSPRAANHALWVLPLLGMLLVAAKAIAWTLIVPPEKATDRLWRGIARYVALATLLVLLVLGLTLEEMSR